MLIDLLERLGGISIDRIRLKPIPGAATEDDLLAALEAPRKRICELIDGILVEKPTGFMESCLTAYLASLLFPVVREQNLGVLSGPDGPFRLRPELVRIPDVAFTSWKRIPGRSMPDAPVPDLVPDLAVEVLSLSNTDAEMLGKRREYFSAGVTTVWQIDPRARTVEAYSSAHTSVTYTEADTLPGDPALAGFTLSLREFFAELDRHG